MYREVIWKRMGQWIMENCVKLWLLISCTACPKHIKQLESPQLLPPNSTHGEWSHLHLYRVHLICQYMSRMDLITQPGQIQTWELVIDLPCFFRASGRFRSLSQPRPRPGWAAHRLRRPLGAWMPPADGPRSRHVRSWCWHKTAKCCQMLSDVVRSQSKRMSPSLKNRRWNDAKYVKHLLNYV